MKHVLPSLVIKQMQTKIICILLSEWKYLYQLKVLTIQRGGYSHWHISGNTELYELSGRQTVNKHLSIKSTWMSINLFVGIYSINLHCNIIVMYINIVSLYLSFLSTTINNTIMKQEDKDYLPANQAD